MAKPDSSNPALELSALQEYFAGRLPERVQDLENAWTAVQASPHPAEPLRELHRLAHTLSGASATFGFPEVTRAARELEVFLATPFETLPPMTGNGTARVEELLQGIRRAAEQEPVPLQPLHVKAGADPSRPPERLVFLLVEDPEMGAELATQLRHYGYEVQILEQVGALAEEVDKSLPDALIVNGTAGAEAVREVRLSRDSGAPPYVVFLSRQSDLAARLEAVRAGGDAYLMEPVDIGSLVEKLDLLTERHTSSRYRVLIVEDDPDVSVQHAVALDAAGMETEAVTDPLQMMEPLYSFRPDLILMDVRMKECTGPELAAVIRQQESYLSTPIVFLSGEDDDPEQLAAIDLGGDEFLTKPVEPRELVSAIAARARRGRVLQSLISHDGLTGLLNHSHLKAQLEAELSRASRDGTQVAYAMMDLDHFKWINDSHGHSVGDRLLRSLGLFLRQRLRRSDILGRYGGDEVAVILPRTDGPTAAQVLERIREHFSQLRHQAAGRELRATLSCGIATYPAHQTAELLVAAADAALYAAKRAGRNRVELG